MMDALRTAAPALLAALLFGGSTPFAKILLGGTPPLMLAGLLYIGSGLGLALILLLRRARGEVPQDAPLRRADLPRLAAVVLLGGAAGPALLMLGLAQVPAATASLLLNAEGIATMVIAWLAFRENADRRILLGAIAILAGAALLSWQPGAGVQLSPGAIFILAACLCWGMDNNLSRQLSSADPVQIAMIKGIVAGTTNCCLALLQHAALPPPSVILGAAVIGLLGYGASLVLFMRGLRVLGAARTGAYFSLAPFIGAVIALLFFGEALTGTLIVAGLLMAFGLALHLAEHHAHEHRHEELEHEHAHVHDAHHPHAHGPEDPPGEPHSHPHRHAALTHTHAHYPDIHHRHRHRPAR